jgi:hypothetical protein
MSELSDIYVKSGLKRARGTVQTIRQLESLRMAVDENGKVLPPALPASTPLDPSWGPGDALKRYRTARAGTVAILDAFAATAPSTGDALITLTKTTPTSGTETIATVRIPNGSQFADPETLIWQARDVPAGAWLNAVVTTPNGAGSVSIACTLEVNR